MPREKPVLKCYNPNIKQTKMWHNFKQFGECLKQGCQ